MKEKQLINSFVLANVSDVVSTAVGLSLPGVAEKGVSAQDMFAQGRFSEALIVKSAITAFMIGIYALAAHRQARLYPAIDKALKISTIILWLVVAWNELNIGLALTDILQHTR